MKAGTRLAKTLHAYLSEAGVEMRLLREVGWFDFLDFDVPDSDDPRVVAAQACTVLLLNAEGRPRNYDMNTLYAVLAFCCSQCDGVERPTDVDRELIRVLHHPDGCTVEAIEEWLCGHYDLRAA